MTNKVKTTVDFRPAKNKISKGIRKGLRQYAKETMPKITDVTPIDTGALRKSERYDVFTTDNGICVRFSANVPYAEEQHENLEYKHKYPTSAKYIIGPVSKNLDELKEWLVKGINYGLTH